MLVTQNRRFNKQYVVGGSSMFNPILNMLASNTANTVREVATKELGKALLDVSKSAATEVGKAASTKLLEKAFQRPNGKRDVKEKLQGIINKHTNDPIAIQDMVKQLMEK